ncbi:TonB-dependent receptor [Reichenbachiella sp. 5M10]|uniref:TonB-dependent receptor n=1 Tax=Reichenbachiella sp. 5M10 TaxID=1889772 RepID=UPI00117B2B10|nr:TonB-dependent receptor [Reichenbachiella sp. 5M10]
MPLKKVIVFGEAPKSYAVQRILEKVCENENLKYELKGGQILLQYYDRPENEYRYTISGKVKDAENGEVLIGATVYLANLEVGVSTNAYGFYSFSIPTGKYKLQVRYIGYRLVETEVEVNKDFQRDFELEPMPYQLEDLLVDESQSMDVQAHSILSSTNRIDMDMAESIPYLGEVDVFQSSLLLPGITNIGEGVSGVNVRGASSDQNLVLMDEAVLYNANHFFGLISIFNPDAINDVEILKGDFPAKYGGRTSSVMHVRQKEGNEKKVKVSGGLGLITSRLMVDGPVLGQKATFLFSARSTFWDLILRNLSDPDFNDVRANFQDLNGKFKYNINSNNKVYFSGYWGGDATKFGTEALQKWGNSVLSLRWNHILNNKHFFNLTSYYTGYRYSVIEDVEFKEVRGRALINDLAFKLDATSYLVPGFILDWGISTIHHHLSPGEVSTGELYGNETLSSLPDERSFESAVYLSSENQFGGRLTTSLGLRLAHFRNTGESDVYVYNSQASKSIQSISDTIKAGSDESKVSYWNLLPRVSVKFQLGENSSVKASYSSSVQYMHLLSNTTSPSSSDAWVMSGYNILPTTMNQITLGVYKYFPLLDLNASTEVYHRSLNHVIDYKNGANLILNQNVETELIYGVERAYGIEFFIKKTLGRWTGWIGYTLSKVERKFDSTLEGESINQGQYYPSDFDRTHDFALTVAFEATERLTLSSNFVFYTGVPYSFPDSKYEVDGLLVPNFPDRNLDRLSNYHRLDVSATYEISPYKKNGEKRNYESNVVFSVYNVYGRKNAQAYFFTEKDGNPGQSSVQQLSVLSFPIPTVTYNFRF